MRPVRDLALERLEVTVDLRITIENDREIAVWTNAIAKRKVDVAAEAVVAGAAQPIRGVGHDPLIGRVNSTAPLAANEFAATTFTLDEFDGTHAANEFAATTFTLDEFAATTLLLVIG